MALTKVGPAGIGSTPGTGYVIGDSFLHSTGLDSTNAKFTGIVTAQTFRVLGNFQVDGTTTTLDTEVTSVDKLEVAANNTTVGVAITQSGSGDILNLYDGSTEVFTVRDGGNVGIKNATGVAEFAVDVGGEIASKNANKEFIGINLVSNEARIRSSYYSGASGAYRPITFYTSDAERLRITSAGKVGINSTAPATAFDVVGQGHFKNNGSSVKIESIPGTNFTQIQLTNTGGSFYVGRENNAGNWFGTGSNYASVLRSDGAYPVIFRVNGANRLCITSAGKVGIGLTNPLQTVVVKGTSANGGDQYSLIQSDNSSTTGGGGFEIAQNGTRVAVFAPSGWLNSNTGSDASLHVPTGKNFIFYNQTTEALRITSAGQLLVNTTTSRSFSDNSGNGPTPAIQIEATNSSAIMSIVAASTADSHRAGTINLGRHRNTNVGGTPTVVNNGDTLGAVCFSGGDGSDMLSVAAHIRGLVDGTPGSNDMPGALSFSTTPDGSSSPYNQERMRITSAGALNIGKGDESTNAANLVEIYVGATDGTYGTIRGKYNRSNEYNRSEIRFGVEDNSNGKGFLAFATGNNSATERLRINYDGKVGIGTGVPGAALHVLSSAYPTATIQRDHAVNYPRLRLSNTANDGADLDGIGDGTGGFRISTVDAGTSTERLRIKSNGGVTIGSGNDDNTWTEFGSNTGGLTLDDIGVSHTGLRLSHGNDDTYLVQGGNSNFYISQYGTGSMIFGVGSSGNERLKITSAGRIGINESTPDTKLHVRNDNSAALKVGGQGGGEYYLEIGQLGTSSSPGFNATGTSTSMLFRLNGTEAMRLNPSGDMGIGTNSPSTELHIKGSNNILRLETTASTGTNYMEFYDGSGRKGYIGYGSGSTETFHFVNEEVGPYSFYTTPSGGSLTERLVITSGGFVGINENDPISLLHVNYTGSQTTTSFRTASHIRLDGTSGADAMSGIGFGYSNSGGNNYYPSAWIGTKVSSWTQYVKHDIIFATRGVDTNSEPSERFRITENGDIKQYYNSKYEQKGYFDTVRSSQNAGNAPILATSLSYAFGYQEAFSTSSGTWVNPYPDLVVGYHTGLRLGGHINYQGTRFYPDHPSNNTSILMSVGNGSYNVVVTNTLSKGGGTFRIAHPHPSKKYTHDLQHSFIEGPQCDNLYRGRVDLVNGTASVNIDTASNMTDGTFVLLNRDIQCFTSNETGWDPVKGSVSGNILTITSQNNSSTDTISWMVIGERQDDKIKSPEMEMTDSDGKLIVEPLTIEESHM